MANTFKKIQTVTVGAGGAATIDFTSIPQTYTDLKIVLSLRSTSGIDNRIEFNGSTINDSSRYIIGNGASVSSGSDASNIQLQGSSASSDTANVFGNMEIYIPNYTSSNIKVVSIDSVTENNATTSYQFLGSGLWSNTAAITSIKLTNSSGNYAQYSSATLYGIYNEVKATGGAITADADFIYHTFTSDGTFTPLQSLNVDYLVVAGGGGGGSRSGGGGGAGGLRCTVGATGGGGSLESKLALSATAYTVTVGAGGAGGPRQSDSSNGSNSVFGSITSTGGGGGASAAGTAARTGGAGGGGTNNGVGGAGTTNQGYAGGNSNATSYDGGGGGGAGAVGANASTAGLGLGGGNGGNGVATSISGSSVTYAGGGGGGSFNSSNHGTGGTGGGGNAANTAPTAGTANRGGGGGGAGNASDTNTTPTGAAGGSGIVIVRYAR